MTDDPSRGRLVRLARLLASAWRRAAGFFGGAIVIRRMAMLALVAGCAPQGQADVGSETVIALEPYFRDLKLVRASIGGRSVRLLLDTGGGNTLITPDLALAIGCRPYGRDVGYRMSGEQVAFARCDSATVRVNGWETQVAPVGVFDLAKVLPKELPPLDGVLALDAFAGSVVSIDWSGDRVVVGGVPGARAMRFRLASGVSGRGLSVTVPVAGRRGELWFLLDSGNLIGTLVDRHLLADSLLVTSGDSTVLVVADGAPFSSRVNPAELILDGALGTDFFRRGPITLDLRAVAR